MKATSNICSNAGGQKNLTLLEKMDLSHIETRGFPAELVDWAGHHAGGVRRLFDDGSGRPTKHVLQTHLLSKLRIWAREISEGIPGTPRIVLLVGGPGNGKTEAIESTIRWLGESLGCQDHLVSSLNVHFHPSDGKGVRRRVRVSVPNPASKAGSVELNIVQDASMNVGSEDFSPGRLLVDELAELASAEESLYLCCVNRGVLDDALIYAQESGNSYASILETITQAVGLGPHAPSCWPLEGLSDIAVWPMDAESLLVFESAGSCSPAETLLNEAVDESRWLPFGACDAGAMCPFCHSRKLLASPAHRNALLSILRWYELVSGKRWSFRDLFSLLSYLLAGNQPSDTTGRTAPCHWAARQVAADAEAQRGAPPSRSRSLALYLLATSSYQHALFHRWECDVTSALLIDIKELDLSRDNTAMGLYYFLGGRRAQYLPATIAPLLDGITEFLDPALAIPDATTVSQEWSDSEVELRSLDVKFSRSVDEGLQAARKHDFLSSPELELLNRLARLDNELASSAARRKKPTAAIRIQRLVRDFSCRLVRRSLGVQLPMVRDETVIRKFQLIVEESELKDDLLANAADQVQHLLNHDGKFQVSLTTTFGQPLPPKSRQATLLVPNRKVRPLEAPTSGRPRAPLRFLTVGARNSQQAIALTYDLFKAVSELEGGLSPASLPKNVVALLDATRGRLSGPLVRDDDVLDEASMVIGANGMQIHQRRGKFRTGGAKE